MVKKTSLAFVAGMSLCALSAAIPPAPTIEVAQQHLEHAQGKFAMGFHRFVRGVATLNYDQTVGSYLGKHRYEFTSVLADYWHRQELVKQLVLDTVLMRYMESMIDLHVSLMHSAGLILSYDGLSLGSKAYAMARIGDIYVELEPAFGQIGYWFFNNAAQARHGLPWTLRLKNWIFGCSDKVPSLNNELKEYHRIVQASEYHFRSILATVEAQIGRYSRLYVSLESILGSMMMNRVVQQENCNNRSIVSRLLHRMYELVGLDTHNAQSSHQPGSLIMLSRCLRNVHDIVYGTQNCLYLIDIQGAQLAHEAAFQDLRNKSMRLGLVYEGYPSVDDDGIRENLSSFVDYRMCNHEHIFAGGAVRLAVEALGSGLVATVRNVIEHPVIALSLGAGAYCAVNGIPSIELQMPDYFVQSDQVEVASVSLGTGVATEKPVVAVQTCEDLCNKPWLSKEIVQDYDHQLREAFGL